MVRSRVEMLASRGKRAATKSVMSSNEVTHLCESLAGVVVMVSASHWAMVLLIITAKLEVCGTLSFWSRSGILALQKIHKQCVVNSSGMLEESVKLRKYMHASNIHVSR